MCPAQPPLPASCRWQREQPEAPALQDRALRDKQRVAECLDIPGPHPPRPCSWPKRKRSSLTITRSRKRQVTQVPHPKGALYSHQEVKKTEC
ncbi:Calcium Permeable Stress-Gated Cation Channel 1 [Manis pentadactyla]|nr:Calcium Permeable Stress-Gated Cation Channel 1 [Manis pentadactyla]